MRFQEDRRRRHCRRLCSASVGEETCVVIGAGPAGLAAAWTLSRVGIDPLILEKGPSVATVWRGRHDHLELNTWRGLSHQPGLRLPRRVGMFPGRDEYVRYLERYATGMRLRPGVEVTRVDRSDSGWLLRTAEGDVATDHAVVATGPDRVPVRPRWPGQDGFTGTVVHAGEFRNVAEVEGRDVLVVGSGNSGTDLLNHLVKSRVGALWLSARHGMTVLPRQLLGVPLHPIPVATRRLPIKAQDANAQLMQRLVYGDLTRFGYPSAEVGPFTRQLADGVTAAIDGGFVRALKTGRVTMKPAIERFDGSTVVFADGSSEQPDVVITATGYRPGLEPLVGHLVNLDHKGLPPFMAATSSPAHPGLWFFGLNRSIYGNMYVRRREAKELAARIAPPR